MLYINQNDTPAGTANPPAPGAEPALDEAPGFEEYLESEQLALISGLRKLWVRLAVWSRSLIVSTAAGLGDIQAITDRLTELPEAFAALLSQYFEPEEADQFRELLEEHISTMEDLVEAEKNNDDKTVSQETENLYNNAGRIAAFLAGINAYWNQGQFGDLLNDYLEMLLAGLVARLEGDYAKELEIFDDLLTQAVKLADYMAQGMLQKFRP
jgi:hypothetical protein